ncbi:hypothetical protein AYI68_g1185 [Smittium mucronatum]|uniref:Uncharacterized protein n=1 Tax=Smittium mucronatum TaxID=133383 RepID=A0A1R0H635_9FUNG|nr:hypothetical protein AYI68_g1185 [Smittium mucronatum]
MKIFNLIFLAGVFGLPRNFQISERLKSRGKSTLNTRSTFKFHLETGPSAQRISLMARDRVNSDLDSINGYSFFAYGDPVRPPKITKYEGFEKITSDPVKTQGIPPEHPIPHSNKPLIGLPSFRLDPEEIHPDRNNPIPQTPIRLNNKAPEAKFEGGSINPDRASFSSFEDMVIMDSKKKIQSNLQSDRFYIENSDRNIGYYHTLFPEQGYGNRKNHSPENKLEELDGSFEYKDISDSGNSLYVVLNDPDNIEDTQIAFVPLPHGTSRIQNISV